MHSESVTSTSWYEQYKTVVFFFPHPYFLVHSTCSNFLMDCKSTTNSNQLQIGET